MEEHTGQSQLEMLAKIHNQLVDLTTLIAEVELSKTTSEILKRKLRQIQASAQHVDAEERPSGAVVTRQQKVIAPIDEAIEPGEAAPDKGAN